jgi:hypothetical protein
MPRHKVGSHGDHHQSWELRDASWESGLATWELARGKAALEELDGAQALVGAWCTGAWRTGPCKLGLGTCRLRIGTRKCWAWAGR